MCVFSLGRKSHSGYGEPRFETNSLVRNKDLLLSGYGDGRGCAAKVGCLGLIFPTTTSGLLSALLALLGRLTLVG